MAESGVIRVKLKIIAVATMVRSKGSPWKVPGNLLVVAATAEFKSNTCIFLESARVKNSSKVPASSSLPTR